MAEAFGIFMICWLPLYPVSLVVMAVMAELEEKK